jgi:hypothetical protein
LKLFFFHWFGAAELAAERKKPPTPIEQGCFQCIGKNEAGLFQHEAEVLRCSFPWQMLSRFEIVITALFHALTFQSNPKHKELDIPKKGFKI